MKLLRSIGVACLAASACGCAGYKLESRRLENEARTDKAFQLHDAGKFQECRDEFDALLSDYDALGKAWDAPHMFPFERTKAWHGRAMCNKGLGRLPEAVSDLNQALALIVPECDRLTAASRADPILRQVRVRAELLCRQRADEMELLARWKKELAANAPRPGR